MADFELPGLKGVYSYWWLPSLEPSKIKNEAGNYGFFRPNGNRRWVPVYWGETENLRDRLPNHERWQEAKRLGATAIVAHTSVSTQSRLNEEADLIAKWQPVLNVQYPKYGTKR